MIADEREKGGKSRPNQRQRQLVITLPDFEKHPAYTDNRNANRREFLKLAALANSLPFLPSPAFASIFSDERTAWYRDAKFGMFIHWGPYSLASVEASWPIMTPKPGGITEAEYVELHKRFNPQNFDARALVELARSAGQRYMVFTTKHDGFCMFDSSYTNYKITNTPYGKDIVQMLTSECREANMPLGFSYSPPDMHHGISGYFQAGIHELEWRAHAPGVAALSRVHATAAYRIAHPLCGPVVLVWFDGLHNQQKYDGRRFLELIHHLQPATLVNDRRAGRLSDTGAIHTQRHSYKGRALQRG
jgi:alpha-L-fucosidase